MSMWSFNILRQYCCPQRTLTHIVGWLANCRWVWFKNWAIKRLIQKYHVNLDDVISADVNDYPDFNSFFTRRLKPSARPIAGGSDIASPADGCISQLGKIDHETLLQAKGFHFSLNALLGGNPSMTESFHNGSYIICYLAPRDYHRVHMPFSGELKTTMFIPGQLFSVNSETAHAVPNLFARNERLVCLFDTHIGPMAVILIGAMLVGSIETVWHKTPYRHQQLTLEQHPKGIHLKKGDELGHFKMGSTVIVLFGEKKTEWLKELRENGCIKMGEKIGAALSEKG